MTTVLYWILVFFFSLVMLQRSNAYVGNDPRVTNDMFVTTRVVPDQDGDSGGHFDQRVRTGMHHSSVAWLIPPDAIHSILIYFEIGNITSRYIYIYIYSSYTPQDAKLMQYVPLTNRAGLPNIVAAVALEPKGKGEGSERQTPKYQTAQCYYQLPHCAKIELASNLVCPSVTRRLSASTLEIVAHGFGAPAFFG